MAALAGFLQLAVVPEVLRAEQLAVRILQLVMHVLGILTRTARATPAHGTDRLTRLDRLAFLHLGRMQVQDLVRVALRIPDLHRTVVAADERHRSGDGRVDGRVLQITAVLAADIVEVGTTVRLVRAVFAELTGNVRLDPVLRGQHHLHRLLEVAGLAFGMRRCRLGLRVRGRSYGGGGVAAMGLALGQSQALLHEPLVLVHVWHHLLFRQGEAAVIAGRAVVVVLVDVLLTLAALVRQRAVIDVMVNQCIGLCADVEAVAVVEVVVVAGLVDELAQARGRGGASGGIGVEARFNAGDGQYVRRFARGQALLARRLDDRVDHP